MLVYPDNFKLKKIYAYTLMYSDNIKFKKVNTHNNIF